MKPEEGIYSGMRDLHLDPCNYFINLGTLIVEGRTPSASERGYSEGPHCLYNDEHHKCNLKLPECQQYDGLVHHLQLLWKHAIPMSVEVLLYPECCKTSFGSHTVDTFPAPNIPYILLEQWTVQIVPKRMSTAAVSPQSLIQALRSFLHFSQLSAWLNLSSGKSPNNICYRISLPDDAFSSKFSGDYSVHTFPVASVNNSTSVKVSVKLHPRQQHVPVFCCRKHERKRSLKCSLKISERKENESPSANDSKQKLVQCTGVNPLTTVRQHSKGVSTNHITKSLLNTSNENISKCCIQSLSPLKEKLSECFIYLPITMLRNMGPYHKYKQTYLNHCKHLNFDNLQNETVDRHCTSDDLNSLKQRYCNFSGLSLHKQKCLEDIMKCQETNIWCSLKTSSPEGDLECILNSRHARNKQENMVFQKNENQVSRFKTTEKLSVLPKTCLRYKMQEPTSDILKNSECYAGRALAGFCRTNIKFCSKGVVSLNHMKETTSQSLHSPVRDISKNNTAHKENSLLHQKHKEIDHIEMKSDSDLSERLGTEHPNLERKKKFLHSDKLSLTPDSEESERVQSKKFDKTIVLHPPSEIPLSYSPAPVRKSGTCFDFDCSLTSVSAIKGALFGKKWNGNTSNFNLLTSSFPCTGSNRLLGNFEETVLNGCFGPVNVVEGFTAEIGASGSFCPSHEILPVTVFFFNLQDAEKTASPYLGHVSLEDRGYRVPRDGTVQLTLFNPHGTVVKMFVVRYDLSDMPPQSQTFIRQRTLYMPTGATENHRDAKKWLRYLIHLRFASTRSGKIYLHTDVKLIILSKMDVDATTLHNQCRYELRSFTQVPANPKFSPRC